MYFDKNDKQIAVKKFNVEYDWKPPMCDLCKVFGHSSEKCKLNKLKEGSTENRLEVIVLKWLMIRTWVIKVQQLSKRRLLRWA